MDISVQVPPQEFQPLLANLRIRDKQDALLLLALHSVMTPDLAREILLASPFGAKLSPKHLEQVLGDLAAGLVLALEESGDLAAVLQHGYRNHLQKNRGAEAVRKPAQNTEVENDPHATQRANLYACLAAMQANGY